VKQLEREIKALLESMGLVEDDDFVMKSDSTSVHADIDRRFRWANAMIEELETMRDFSNYALSWDFDEL
jgi:hypothetical protein